MKLKKSGVVYTSDKREVLFHSVLECPDGVVRMYANRWNYEFRTVCRESTDGGKTFGHEIEVLNKSGATHNFYTFLGEDGVQYGIGGIDAWKMQAKWQTVDDFETFKKIYVERFGEEYTKNEDRFKVALTKMKKRPLLQHTDGLYLFKTGDGLNFKEIAGPIVTTDHDGFNSALVWGKSTEFDGHISCVYNKQQGKYFLYLRNNIRQKVRYIQFSTSEDLINWGEFKNINIKTWNSDIDNYYSPVIFAYKDFYVGLVPWFHVNLQGSIRIIKSTDGENWDIIHDLFPEMVMKLKGAPKNRKQAVNGVILRDGCVSIYIHCNYLGLVKKVPVQVLHFIVDAGDFNRMLKC